MSKQTRGRHGSEQCQRVAPVIGARTSHPNAGEWFRTILASLQGDESLADDTLYRLEHNCRGDYGLELLHFERDDEAHVWFWRALFERYPNDVRVQALYADVLYNFSFGHRDRAQAGFRLWLDAVRRDPEQFIRSAGEFHDVAKEGRDAWLEYRLVTLRFYLHELKKGDVDEDIVRETMREIFHEFRGDVADIVDRVREIVRESEVNL